jgi:probable phosphoglycerate mutase
VLGQLDTAHPGPGLTELGHGQAHKLGETLANAGIGALYASTLIRTQLTAAPVARAQRLEVEVRPGLHEIGAGELELRSDRESIRRYLETVYAWGLGDLAATMPGGGDGHEFFGRFDEEISAMENSGVDVAAAVSHGAAIRVWVSSRARNITPSFGAEHPLDNTGIVTLEGNSVDGWILTRWAGAPVGPINSTPSAPAHRRDAS